MEANIKKIILTLLLFAGIVVSYTPEGGFRLSAGTEAQAKEEDEDEKEEERDPWDNIEIRIWSDLEDFLTFGDYNVIQDVLSSLDYFNHENDFDENFSSGYCYGCAYIGAYDGATILDGIGARYESSGGSREVFDGATRAEIEERIRELYGVEEPSYSESNEPDEEDPWEDDGGNPSNETAGSDPFNPNIPNQPNREKPEVVKEIDCTEADQKVKQIKENLLEKPAVQEKLNALRATAQDETVRYEKGTVVDFDFNNRNSGNPYSFNNQHTNPATPSIIDGQAASINLSRYVNVWTVLDIHTHPEFSGRGVFPNNPSPSIGDVQMVLSNAYYVDREQSKNPDADYRNNPDRTYKGGFVTAYDGSEYMLYVADINALKTFWEENGKYNIAEKNPKGNTEFKTGTKIRKNFEDALEQFRTKGFNYNEAYLFAVTYVLQQNNAGIKVMKKNADIGEFEELFVRVEGEEYTPVSKRCP